MMSTKFMVKKNKDKHYIYIYGESDRRTVTIVRYTRGHKL